MNRNEDRWRQCYWKEWEMIKKRWDALHASWRQQAEGQNKVGLSRVAVHRPGA